jgi:hypothetical protein
LLAYKIYFVQLDCLSIERRHEIAFKDAAYTIIIASVGTMRVWGGLRGCETD